MPKKIILLAALVIVGALLFKFATREARQVNVTVTSPDRPILYNKGDYLTLLLEPREGEAFSTAGWQVAIGEREFVLGNASPLPRQGQVNEELPITITRPTHIIVSPGRSPIGVSFRENKCVGMLGRFQEFVPPLPTPCSTCNEQTANYPDYNTCVDNHRTEADFFIDTWRVYLGEEGNMSGTEHKVIRLRDEKGKLMDISTY